MVWLGLTCKHKSHVLVVVKQTAIHTSELVNLLQFGITPKVDKLIKQILY